jgi:hypothetical protein
MSNYNKASLAMEIAKQIHPFLAGLNPEIQGAVLADLLATWLAGFPQQGREVMLQMHLAGMRPLIEVNEKIQFGKAGHPHNESSH